MHIINRFINRLEDWFIGSELGDDVVMKDGPNLAYLPQHKVIDRSECIGYVYGIVTKDLGPADLGGKTFEVLGGRLTREPHPMFSIEGGDYNLIGCTAYNIVLGGPIGEFKVVSSFKGSGTLVVNK